MNSPERDHRYIDGRTVATRIFDECKKTTSKHTNLGRIISISIGDIPEIDVYVRNQARGAQRAGLPFEKAPWPDTITQDDAKHAIQDMNDDPTVLGIILQRPAPAHINVRSLQSAIHPLKDIEGMNPASIGNIIYSDVALAPCTAAASVEAIHSAVAMPVDEILNDAVKVMERYIGHEPEVVKRLQMRPTHCSSGLCVSSRR